MNSACSSSSSITTFDGPYEVVLETVTPLRLNRPSQRKFYTLSTGSYSSLNSAVSSPSVYSMEDSPRQEFDSPRSLDGYMGYKPVRPLPILPGSAPASATCHPSRASLRPLPLPPPSPQQPSISISPASPQSPVSPKIPTTTTRDIGSPYPLPNPHIQPPPRTTSRHRPNLYSSLSLDVSERTLAPPAYQARAKDTLLPTPIVPSPAASTVASVSDIPTPITDRRQRISKLRRHLGEGIPDELIPFMCATDTVKARLKVLRESRSEENLFSACKSTLDFGTIFKNEDDEDNDDDDSSSIELVSTPSIGGKKSLELEEDERRPKEIDAAPKGAYRAKISKRYSTKWMREKGGRRWEEQDYNALMNALRAL
ncbi:hypothetical protein K435DRAFT_777921 [Dendrothele bispora CBS 962.96]|uniref:Uncharacterized protein n=1 Tax=Dendrothele bispora (strain CBS 962.96) TaxID=1314807 RepID=A0A4S8M5V0_DENBC|nr:hypothetical protein K435DRAFT_777921 [Dendrothele bispora CBS 962.96]